MAGKSGWLSIYFGGLRFPVSVPHECAVALFSGEQVAAARAHLEANKGRILEYLDGGMTSFVGESEVEAVADAGAVAHIAR